MNQGKFMTIIVAAGIGALTAIGFSHVEGFQSHVTYAETVPKANNVKYVNLTGTQAETTVNFVTAAEMSVPAVVHIKTTYAREQNNGFNTADPFYNLFFGQAQPQPSPQQMSTGSGVIVSEDGYIVTNNHVVENADKIEITLNDKRSYSAKLIGRDPNTDLALLKINEHNLPILGYGNSDDVKVGEWVLAVGNPFNLTSTVTAGIVSAKGRNLDGLTADPQAGFYPIESFIQTDAAINPGNSGGALVNTKGELVGINAAIKSNTGSYAGYSFAIPVNIVKKVIGDLVEFGEVQRAFLGVSIHDLDAKFAAEKNIKQINGVYVQAVSPNGSAETGGILAGDVIVKIGDVEVNKVSELQEQISKYRPGDKISVGMRRNNEPLTVALTLKNSKGNTAVVKQEKSAELNLLGANFEPISANDMKRLNVKFGVKITRLSNGKLRSAGIKEGFIITKIDKKEIHGNEDLQSALENKEGGVLIEGIYAQNGLKAYYGFGL